MIFGDKLTVDANEDLTNKLQPFNSLAYVLSDGTKDDYDGSDTLYDYQVRTRLDIVAGPDLPQTLSSDEQIILNGTTPITDTTFRTNYLIQRSGNGIIDTELEGVEFNIINYSQEQDPSEEYSGKVNKQGSQYKVEFKDLTYNASNVAEITINVPYVSDKTTEFMVYFLRKDNTETVSVNNVNVASLEPKVNMLKVASGKTSVKFTITSTSGASSESYILIDEVKVIDGVNSIFNLVSGQETTLNSELSNLAGDVVFYSTYNIPYAKLIDIDDFKKPEVM